LEAVQQQFQTFLSVRTPSELKQNIVAPYVQIVVLQIQLIVELCNETSCYEIVTSVHNNRHEHFEVMVYMCDILFNESTGCVLADSLE
jgi:hypothetical protein